MESQNKLKSRETYGCITSSYLKAPDVLTPIETEVNHPKLHSKSWYKTLEDVN